MALTASRPATGCAPAPPTRPGTPGCRGTPAARSGVSSSRPGGTRWPTTGRAARRRTPQPVWHVRFAAADLFGARRPHRDRGAVGGLPDPDRGGRHERRPRQFGDLGAGPARRGAAGVPRAARRRRDRHRASTSSWPAAARPNGARIVARAWVDPGFARAAARRREQRDPRGRAVDGRRAAGAAAEGGRQHRRRAQRRRLHAVLVLPDRAARARRRAGTRARPTARGWCATRAACSPSSASSCPPDVDRGVGRQRGVAVHGAAPPSRRAPTG